MAFLEDEPAAEQVEDLLVSSQEDGSQLLMATINLGEVWYSLARARSENEADEAEKQIRRLGILVVDADWELTRQAASFKAKNRIAYADCYAAALAKLKRADLVTGDKEFKQLER